MNKEYIKYLLKSNKKMIILQFVLALVIILMPSVILENLSDITMSMTTVYYFVSCIIVPFLFVKKYYNKTSMDVYGALPIDRKRLIRSEMFTSYGIIFTPSLVITLITYVSILLGGKEMVNYYDPYFTSLNVYEVVWVCWLNHLFEAVKYGALFSVSWMVLLKAKSMLDGIVFSVGYLTSYYLVPFFFKVWLEGMSCIRLYSNNYSGYLTILDATLGTNFIYRGLIKGMVDRSSFYPILGATIILFVLVIIVSYKETMKTAMIRKNEDISMPSCSRIGYPMLIVLLTTILGLGLSTFDKIDLYFFIYLFFSFVVYMVLVALYKRKITYSIVTILLFIGLTGVGTIGQKAYLMTDGFGSFTVYPEYVDTMRVEINFYDEKYSGVNFDEKYDRLDEVDYAKICTLTTQMLEVHKTDNKDNICEVRVSLSNSILTKTYTYKLSPEAMDKMIQEFGTIESLNQKDN